MADDPRILVDASSFLYRAFHALPDLRAPDGLPTGAIFGVANMLRRLEREYPSDEIIVVFDAPGPTFRDAIFPEYKAHRPPMPEEMRVQVDSLYQWIRATGLPLLVEPGVEADDVIGTLARQTPVGRDIIIVSGDKDMAQLVDGRTRIVDTMKGTVLDLAAVQEKWGILPGQVADYLALVGDKADNIPGVPGAGQKTAARWLAEYGHLEGIMAHADALDGKAGRSLRESLSFLPRSRELARIRCDLELPGQNYVRQPADVPALRHLAERLGFHAWLKDLPPVELPEDQGRQKGADGPVHRWEYLTIIHEDQLEVLLEKLQKVPVVAVDTETTALDPHDADLVGISVAWQEEGDGLHAAYIPVGHSTGEQLDRSLVLRHLRPWLEDSRPAKIAQNAKFDWQIFWSQGISPQGLLRDTMLESYVLDSTRSGHDLDSLAVRFLEHRSIAYSDLVGSARQAKNFAEVPIEEATAYAGEDADVCFRLDKLLWPMVSEQPGLRHVLMEIEMPLVPVLARMEWAGVKIDRTQLEVLGAELEKSMASVERRAHDMAGYPFNLNSPRQIQELLYDRMQLPIRKKTPGGQASTSEDILVQLGSYSPLPGLILEYRSLAKLKNTYADALPQMIQPRTGRVHTHFRQAVTATGRLSSSDPNLQNIPVRTEQGRRIRRAFVAEPGHLLLGADYSQIELRIMAHLSQDAGLLQAFAAGEDIHRATAAEVFGVPLEAVDSEKRRAAKAINFGLIYGQTAYGLAQQLGTDQNAARAYMDRYFERYPGVLQYMEHTRVLAREQGYVETLFGRRLYVSEIRSRNPARRSYAERAAINAPMQGTAADIIKLAMVAVDGWLQEDPARGGRMILQVHDEIVLEVPEMHLDVSRDSLRERMEGVVALSVPLKVGMGWGASWDAVHS